MFFGGVLCLQHRQGQYGIVWLVDFPTGSCVISLVYPCSACSAVSSLCFLLFMCTVYIDCISCLSAFYLFSRLLSSNNGPYKGAVDPVGLRVGVEH